MTDKADQNPCAHEGFRAACDAIRLTGADGGPVTGYSLNVRVMCIDCGTPFRFVGIAAGSSPTEPKVSIDGTELRAPIEPAEHEVFAAVATYITRPLKGMEQ